MSSRLKRIQAIKETIKYYEGLTSRDSLWSFSCVVLSGKACSQGLRGNARWKLVEDYSKFANGGEYKTDSWVIHPIISEALKGKETFWRETDPSAYSVALKKNMGLIRKTRTMLLELFLLNEMEKK